MQKVLIILGAILIVLGLILPYLNNLGIGRLPGDIIIKKNNFNLYFPVTSAIIFSIVVSIILKLFK
tara:strand:+ start:3631 stop:3828 length:198 start_codon:yes stop_codon:yes gene_type:complete